MKTFIFYVSTGEDWELCESIYLVNAKSKEKAEKDFQFDNWDTMYPKRKISKIEEFDMSVKGQYKLQDGFTE